MTSVHENVAWQCLHESARDDAVALVVRDHHGERGTITRAELRERARREARVLADIGVDPGDRVVLRLGNGIDFAATWFGALALGAIAVPVSTGLTRDELAFIAEDATPRALVCDATDDVALDLDGIVLSGRADIERPLPIAPVHAEDPAWLVYTSGTSSRPRGVLHAHRALAARRIMLDAWTGLQPGDVVLHTGRMNWSYTLGVGLMDPLLAGATSLIYDGPNNPRTWMSLLREERATVFATVPTILRQMVARAPDELGEATATLRHVLSAGESLSAAVRQRWRELTGVEVFEALGMSECSTYVSSGPGTPVRAGRVGRSQPGRPIAILPFERGATQPLPPGTPGLLAVSTSDPGMMLRYWNDPEADRETRRGTWFVGGDVAEIDRDGYLTFHGRADDVINVFGHRVSSLEVEHVIEHHPGVRECAVVTTEVRADVEIPVAWIVRVDGTDVSANELRDWAQAHLAPYKRPRAWEFTAALPRTANGKVRRAELRGRGVTS